MADFCKQCSINTFGEDFKELANLMLLEEYDAENGVGAVALCECCGTTIVVDETGERLMPASTAEGLQRGCNCGAYRKGDKGKFLYQYERSGKSMRFTSFEAATNSLRNWGLQPSGDYGLASQLDFPNKLSKLSLPIVYKSPNKGFLWAFDLTARPENTRECWVSLEWQAYRYDPVGEPRETYKK